MSDQKDWKCQTCGHKCVAFACGKTSDQFFFRWPGGKEHSGYVLPNELIGIRQGDCDDYMEFSYCLVCGQISGDWPVKGAAGYLRKYAEKRLWEVIICNDQSSWDVEYFLASTKEKVEEETRGYKASYLFVIECGDDEAPEGAEVRELI